MFAYIQIITINISYYNNWFCGLNPSSKANGIATTVSQSIALEETAISHILNAEGEKIQKVLTLHNCDSKDILEVNKSVQDTIDKITDLETILKAKLDLIVPILDECDKKPPKPECWLLSQPDSRF